MAGTVVGQLVGLDAVAEHHRFAGVLGQVLDQPARVVIGPVRVVRGEQQDLLAFHPLEGPQQFGLVLGVVQRLGGELDVLLDVLTGLALDVHPRLARGVDGVHPPHQRQDPVESVLDEHDAQGGVAVEDAVEDQAHHLVGGQQRVADHEVVVVAREADRRNRQRVEDTAAEMAADRDVVLGRRRPHRVVLRVAPGRFGLGLDQDLHHVGVVGPLLDLAGRALGILDGHADRAAPALVPVVLAVQPVLGLPGVVGVGQRGGGLRDPAVAVHGLEHGDVRAGLHDRLPERQIGIAAGEFAVVGEGVDPHRVRVGVVGRVVVDQLADPVVHEVLAADRLRDVLLEHSAPGHRVDVGVDAAHRDALGGGDALLDVGESHRGLLARL